MMKILLATCAILACNAILADESANLATVHNFVAAYNAHDENLMLTFVNDDIRWMSVKDGTVNTESDGKKELARSMQSYFEGMPSTRAELRDISSTGNFVSAVEEVHWKLENETQSQCAVSVYELKGALISNVWYFAADKCIDTGEQ